MSEFLKMDIFFVITTLVVLVLGAIAVLIGMRIYRILGHIEKILDVAARESESIKDDLDDIRADLRKSGYGLFPFMRFVWRMSKRFTKDSRD